MQPTQADLLDMDLPALSGARYDSGFGAYTPAQQMMMVQAATTAFREHEATAVREDSATDMTVGSWAAGMEAVWGALSAMQEKKEAAGQDGAAAAVKFAPCSPSPSSETAASAGTANITTIDGVPVVKPQLAQEGTGAQPVLVNTVQVTVTSDGITE